MVVGVRQAGGWGLKLWSGPKLHSFQLPRAVRHLPSPSATQNSCSSMHMPGSRIHPLPSTACSCLPCLPQEGNDIRFGDWTQHDINWLNQVQARLPVRCCVGGWVGGAALL